MPGVRDRVAQILRCIDRYNPDNAGVLAEYLLQTGETGTSDVEAYLALIKLYQFNPHLFDLETTCSVLLKTLSSLPSPDFNLCLSMLSEEQHDNPRIAKLVQLSQYLEVCDFELFWGALASDPSILTASVRVKQYLSELSPEDVVQSLQTRQLTDEGTLEEQKERLADDISRESGTDEDEELQTWIYRPLDTSKFNASIQKFVAHVINRTYQVIARVDVGKMANLQGDALTEFIASQGWKEAAGDDGGEEVFVSSKVDSVKSKSVIERIDFSSFTGFLANSV